MPYINTNQTSRTKICNTIQLIQANVGIEGAANDLTLSLAFENKIDILFLQEPWVGEDLERKMSKKHNACQAYSPQKKWEERQRVITYVQHNGLHRYIEKRQDRA